jgi:hygromycin-B 7''-O-kinase
VFYVGDAVVKIYTPYFHGRESLGMEVAVLQNLALDPSIPVPKVRASGDLLVGSSDWNWPYVVLSRVPGRVLAEDWPTLDTLTRARVLREVGAIVSKIHRVAPSALVGETFRKVWARGFASFLERQLDGLRLARELDAVAIADEARSMAISPTGPAWPVLLHGDLSPDHVLVEGGHVVGLLDFGDAKLGDPLYDFVGIRLNFTDNQQELASFSQGYGTASFPLQDGRLRLLQYALLHEWTTPTDIARWCARSGARTLVELGTWMFP